MRSSFLTLVIICNGTELQRLTDVPFRFSDNRTMKSSSTLTSIWLLKFVHHHESQRAKQYLVKDEKILYHKDSSWVVHTLGTLYTWIIHKIQHTPFFGSIFQLSKSWAIFPKLLTNSNERLLEQTPK